MKRLVTAACTLALAGIPAPLGMLATSDAAVPVTMAAKVAAKKTPESDTHLSPRASRSHARTRMALYGWSHRQFDCLDALWTRESNWRSAAYNKTPVKQWRNGRWVELHAGGIPQLLNLDPRTSSVRQIRAGMDYIAARYTNPCNALAFWTRKHWY